jgi:hypothetical protein
MKPMFGLTMGSDIIDEIEKYLLKFRRDDDIKLKTQSQSPLNLHVQVEAVDTVDQSTPTGASFNKTWCKLGLPEKLNRLMRYLSKVQHKLSLDSKKTEELRKFFYENVNTTLASDECVSYDPVEGDIVTIIGLKYGDNEFYLQTHTAPKPEGLRVKQRVFTSITHLLSSGSPASETSASALSPAVVSENVVVTQGATAPPQKKIVVIKKKN